MSYPMPSNTTIGEVKGYPKESLKAMAFQAVRRCRVTWDERYNWAKYFLYNGPATNNYPYFVAEGLPTQSTIIRLGIEPDANTRLTHGTIATSQAEYTHALLTLVYESAGFNGDAVVIEEVRPRNDMQYLYADSFYFANGKTLGARPSIYVPGFEYVLTYPRAKSVPGIVTYPGLVNFDVYVMKMLPLYIMPFCGLYSGSYINGTFDYDGTATLGLSHHILVRSANWNYEFNPATGNWEPIYTRTGAMITKHAATGFNSLL